MRYVMLLFVALLFTAPAQAQDDGWSGPTLPKYEGEADSAAVGPQPKDPSLATVLGFIMPGAGHLYVGETGKGAMLLGAATLGPIVGATMAANKTQEDCLSDYSCDDTAHHMVWLYAGIGAAAISWIISVTDAGPAARRYNQQHAVRAGLSVQAGRPALAVRVGL